MRTFKKSNFLAEYKTPLIECACGVTEDEELMEEPLEELVDSDGSRINGSTPDGSESNIQVGPVQSPKKEKGQTTYKQGIATTTDDVRSLTSQGPDWQAAYGGLGGTYYSHGVKVNTGSWVPWVGGVRSLNAEGVEEGEEIDEHMVDSGGIRNGLVGDELEENMTKMVEKMLTKKDKEELKLSKVDLDLTKKGHIDDLISKIKELDPEAKKKLEKLLSDAKSGLTE